ncbi:MAG: dicarboxylate/amino acid:cation symporter [Syntrophaceae bacterium]|nr:dicarboxylate/amino acid:cation symporter [Syntrophaceae bacterium]
MAAEKSEKSGFMAWYFESNLLIRILIGLILGAIVGLIAGPWILWVKPFGDIFIRLLRMIVVPVILFSLVVGAASLSPARLGRVGVKIMVYYIATTVVAVAIGLVFANILRPGDGLNLSAGKAAGRALTQPNVVDTLMAIIPVNPFESLAKGDVLPIIFFAIVFGISLSFLSMSKDERLSGGAAAVLRFFDGAVEATYKIVRGVMQYAPIGVFALIAVVFAQQGAKALGPLGLVTLTVYLGLLAHLLIVYGGLLSIFGLKFNRFLGGAKEAMLTAFVTRSSSATLPITMRNSEENLGVPRSIGSFTLPLGATINMDGTAIYQGICALFVAFAIGAPLDFASQMTIIITATLASIGAAGVPGAGAIMLLMVLNSVGLEVKEGTAVAMAYAMILGIDAILDMGRTCMNITGDLAGTSIVAKTEKSLDLKKWA